MDEKLHFGNYIDITASALPNGENRDPALVIRVEFSISNEMCRPNSEEIKNAITAIERFIPKYLDAVKSAEEVARFSGHKAMSDLMTNFLKKGVGGTDE